MTDKKPTVMEMLNTATSLLKSLKVALESNPGEISKEELDKIYWTDLETIARSIRLNSIRQLARRKMRPNEQTKEEQR